MKNQNLPSENLGLMPSACRQAHSHREGFTCVVADSTGLRGLSEIVSSEQPLLMDDGLLGAPGYVINLTNAAWGAFSAHGGDGGNVFYNGGQAAFRKRMDCGLDETNGYILLP